MDSLYSGLVDYWPLNEASGDAYGLCAGNQLADTNTVTQNPGIVTYARQFTAANSERLVIASNANVQAGDVDFSVACWVYFDSKGAYRGIITKDDNSTLQDYTLFYSLGTDRISFQVFKPTNVSVIAAANALGSPAISTWYFVVGWHDAANDTLYIEVNANLLNSIATGGALQAPSAAAFTIGSFSSGLYMNGRICEAGLWKRILTPAERAWLYNGGEGRTYPFDGRMSPAMMGRNPFQVGARRSRVPGIIG